MNLSAAIKRIASTDDRILDYSRTDSGHTVSLAFPYYFTDGTRTFDEKTFPTVTEFIRSYRTIHIPEFVKRSVHGV